ncbi:hypothetical protein [Oceanospirillum sp.]|uniref:hypothetical protein n=1 Tax=Oceanospirillum sp. TaxID=2021254 RepID=UPI003A930168
MLTRHRLLIADNSIFFRDALAQTLMSQVQGLQVDSVKNCAGGKQLLAQNQGEYMAVISGLVLEDAAAGAMLDLAAEYKIPAIALTSSLDRETRQLVMDRDVIDYFFKDQDGLEGIISLIRRLISNRKHKVLVVDDAPTYCAYLSALLERQQYQVVVAHTGDRPLIY